jgi:hypothetical protein
MFLPTSPSLRPVPDQVRYTSIFVKNDAGIAAAYRTLMAKGLGTSTCLLGLKEIAINKSKMIKQSLGIGEHEHIDAALALGYSNLVWHQIPPRGPVKVVWDSAEKSQSR